MDKKHFANLLEGIRQMDRHIKGKQVPGARVTKVAEIEPKKIRLAAGLSQSEFAQLIGVPLKTLQNWEQNRTKPAGTARALLKIVASNPKSAIEALHA